MKKFVFFVFLTVLVLFITLIWMNFPSILQGLKAFPKDWIIAFFLGASAMFLAQAIVNRKDSGE